MTEAIAERPGVLREWRLDPDATRRVLEGLVPDPDLRLRLIGHAAHTIEAAHRLNPASWSVTLEPGRVTINVGRVLAWRFAADEIWVLLAADALDPEPQPGDWRSKAIPGMLARGLESRRLLETWPRLEAAHDAAVEVAARIRRTPYYTSHSPGALDYFDQVLGGSLPRPSHQSERNDGGRIPPAVVRHLLEQVRRSFPQWDGFSHQPFIDDEVTYKQRAAAQAREQLGYDAFAALLERQDVDEILLRLRRVASSLNLLYLGTPSQGDLALLHAEDLDRLGLCHAIFDLLHGEGETPVRLDRFILYLEQHDLPSKWTFPTYFLFLLDPVREFFVKPGVTRNFLGLLELTDLYSPAPSGEAYAAILHLVAELAEALVDSGLAAEPRDMIDLQSFLYAALWKGGSAATDFTGGTRAPEATSPSTPEPESTAGPPFSLEQVAQKTSLEPELLERWVRAIERKKQAVLYGPPGTGKTYLAGLLARHLAGEDGFYELMQFHASTSYEDFIQGIRPEESADGGLRYPVKPGRFLDFCRRARMSQGTAVLVIDEINRAELSRVFGELLFLLEYRGREIPLAAGGGFAIPENVRLLGTMNTADRSVARVDLALRRRFAFLGLWPQPEILRQRHRGSAFPVEALIELLAEVNGEIGDPHYHLGVTYFLPKDLHEVIEDVWCLEIEPYLEDFFFDQPSTVNAFRWSKVRRRLGL